MLKARESPKSKKKMSIDDIDIKIKCCKTKSNHVSIKKRSVRKKRAIILIIIDYHMEQC